MQFIDSVDEIARKYECSLLFVETTRLPIFANIYIFESVNFENLKVQSLNWNYIIIMVMITVITIVVVVFIVHHHQRGYHGQHPPENQLVLYVFLLPKLLEVLVR